MASERKFLFLAIKPEFANRIINREKSIELRKLRPHVAIGDYVIIYASTPIRCVLGYGRIKSIIECTPNQMWNNYSDSLGIDSIRFKNYYAGRTKAIGIEMDNIRKIKPVSLEQLRLIDKSFRPPQGFRFISNEHISSAIEKFIKDNND